MNICNFRAALYHFFSVCIKSNQTIKSHNYILDIERSDWIVAQSFLKLLCMILFSFYVETWVPKSIRCKMSKYSNIMDAMVFVEMLWFHVAPMSPIIFFLFSPHHEFHPRQVLPSWFGMNENIVCVGASMIIIGWLAYMINLALMLFMVFGTIYISEIKI